MAWSKYYVVAVSQFCKCYFCQAFAPVLIVRNRCLVMKHNIMLTLDIKTMKKHWLLCSGARSVSHNLKRMTDTYGEVNKPLLVIRVFGFYRASCVDDISVCTID